MTTGLLQSLTKRFAHPINLEPAANDYIIASVSHPYFKLRWVPAKHYGEMPTIVLKNSRHTTQSTDVQLTTSLTDTGDHDNLLALLPSAPAMTEATTGMDNKLQVDLVRRL